LFVSLINGQRFLTRFELARVVGTRALQISHGAKVNVDTAGMSNDPIVIAVEELKARKIDMIIRRNLPNGRYESVRVADLVRFFFSLFFSSLIEKHYRFLMRVLWIQFEELA
jgi:DNA-directed RNA polymerase subunit K/omega